MHINICKVHTAKDIAVAAALFAAGAATCLVHAGLGTAFIFISIGTLLLYRTGYRDNGKGPLLRKEVHEVIGKAKERWKSYINGENVELDFDSGDGGNTMLVEVYYNSDEKVAYVQLFDFCSYSYERASEMVKMEGSCALYLIDRIKSKQ